MLIKFHFMSGLLDKSSYAFVLFSTWFRDKMELASCQIEPSCTLEFIGSNDPRLLPADQSRVNACCSDERGEGLVTWKRTGGSDELRIY